MRERLPLPRAIQDAPELEIGLEIYYDAFFELSTDRPQGGQIPWSSIRSYAEMHQLDPDQTSDLFHFVRELDGFFLEWHRNKREKETKK